MCSSKRDNPSLRRTYRLEESGYPARPRCVTPPGYSRPRYSQLSACHSHRYSFSFNNRRRRRRCRREAAAVRPPEAAERTDLGTHRLEESGYSTQPRCYTISPDITPKVQVRVNLVENKIGLAGAGNRPSTGRERSATPVPFGG